MRPPDTAHAAMDPKVAIQNAAEQCLRLRADDGPPGDAGLPPVVLSTAPGREVHFALTYAFWLVSYPAIVHAAARWGTPATFTVVGVICLVLIMLALAIKPSGGAHTH